jgi:MFS family permease
MAASSLALGLMAPSWPVAAVGVAAACFGATGVGWNGVFLAAVARMAGKEDAGRATGGVLFVTFTGVVVSPPLFGVLALLSGSYGTGFLALAVAVTLCGFVLWPEKPRP